MSFQIQHRSSRERTGLGALAALGFAILCISATSEAGRAAPDHRAVSASKAETDNYVVEIAASGGYKAGAEGSVKVTLVAKGNYHINAQYPYKFKTAAPPPDGISYPKPVLNRPDGTFEATRASFQVPFVAAKTGKATVGGIFHLSVCSEANCIMDKVPLDITVDVK